MKRFLDHRSNRFGYDGWALRIKGSQKPLDWSVCTTREEARELRREVFPELDFFDRTEVVKVKIDVTMTVQ